MSSNMGSVPDLRSGFVGEWNQY